MIVLKTSTWLSALEVHCLEQLKQLNKSSHFQVCLTIASKTWQKAYFASSITAFVWLPLIILIVIYISITRRLFNDQIGLYGTKESTSSSPASFTKSESKKQTRGNGFFERNITSTSPSVKQSTVNIIKDYTRIKSKNTSLTGSINSEAKIDEEPSISSPLMKVSSIQYIHPQSSVESSGSADKDQRHFTFDTVQHMDDTNDIKNDHKKLYTKQEERIKDNSVHSMNEVNIKYIESESIKKFNSSYYDVSSKNSVLNLSKDSTPPLSPLSYVSSKTPKQQIYSQIRASIDRKLYCLTKCDSLNHSQDQPKSLPKDCTQMKARRQVVYMLAIVVTCFFICLIPFRLFTLWILFSSSESARSLGMENYYIILYSTRIMLYLNSAINPILYNLISSKFRDAFWSTIRCQKSHRLLRHSTFNTTSSSMLISFKNSLREQNNPNANENRERFTRNDSKSVDSNDSENCPKTSKESFV